MENGRDNEPTADAPSPYRVYKGSGQAYINVAGKRLYLGRDGRPATIEKYNQLVSRWMANGGQLRSEPDDLRIKELIARFWIYAEQCYYPERKIVNCL